jgi:serine protease Do
MGRMKMGKTPLCLLVLLAGLAGAPGLVLPRAAPASLDLARQLNQAFIEVAEKVSPAVVVVSVAHKADYEPAEGENPFWDLPSPFRRQLEEWFFRQPERRPRSRAPVFDGQGSGIVIREDGYILTNRHVVDGAARIRVRFKNGKEYDAEIRGVDAQSDIAVIKIDAKGLSAAKLGNSDKVKVGEFAVAIGAPFELDYSVTFGHVSAKGRRIIADPAMDQDFIQTDANINPGNSGGPLVNIDSEVIGVNTLIRGLRTGIGFAIPSNLAREVADKLIAEGKYRRSWLGVEIRALSDFVDYKDMAEGVQEGVVVTGIVQDGPAAKSDLRLGDVITAVDGKAVTTAQQLKAEVRAKRIGQSATLDVVRKGKRLAIKVKPDEWPEDVQPVAGKRRGPSESEPTDVGLTLRPLTRELAKQYDVEPSEGLLVTAVEPGSLAYRKGIQRGDVITEINGQPVAALADFRSAMKKADLKKGIIVNLISQGVSKFVILKDTGE